MTILSILNLTGGHYRFEFSEPVTVTNNSVTDDSFILINLSQTEAETLTWASLGTGLTHVANANNDFTAAQICILVDQPLYLSAANPFQVTTPIPNVT